MPNFNAAVVTADDELLDDRATAKLLDVSAGTLPVWRSTKRYDLPYVKVGRNVRYQKSDILEFIRSRKVER